MMSLSLFCSLIVYIIQISSYLVKSTITEKMAAVHFPSNALRSKIFKKANGCLLKERHKAGSSVASLTI